MAWLPHGEKISKISLFVLAQLTNLTDGRIPADGKCIASCGRKGGDSRTCPGGENVRGNMSEGEMSSGKCPDPVTVTSLVAGWLVGWLVTFVNCG